MTPRPRNVFTPFHLTHPNNNNNKNKNTCVDDGSKKMGKTLPKVDLVSIFFIKLIIFKFKQQLLKIFQYQSYFFFSSLFIYFDNDNFPIFTFCP